jgi:hypothetical protein
MKEIFNFLPEKDFLKIKEFFTSSYMPWYYNKNQTAAGPTVVEKKPDSSFFSHRFYYYNKPETDAKTFNFIKPIIDKINPSKLLRVKANLIVNTGVRHFCNFHLDSEEDEQYKVAVYYITTCNGYTLLDPKHKIKIKCEGNKLAIFDGKIKHCVASQTDKDQRIVLNINYI